MLDRLPMMLVSVFVITLVAFFGFEGIAMVSQITVVQNEAQAAASSMGKWGGYTNQAENSVREMTNRLKLSRRDVNVEISEKGPVPWGKSVSTQITIPFDFKVGKYGIGTITLVGHGKAVSSYLGAYDVSYVSP